MNRLATLAVALTLVGACKGSQTSARSEPVAARHAPREDPVAPLNSDTTEAGVPTTAPTASAAPASAAGTSSSPSTAALRAMPSRQRAEAAVPPLDAATVAHIRAVFAEGARAGLRAEIFAKLGDSITESGSYLTDIGHGWFDLGPWSRLDAVVRYYRRRSPSDNPESNSFTRASGAAEAGWTTNTLLGPNNRMITELTTTRAAVTILMIGTNDAERSDIATYTRNLEEIVRRIEAQHVVLALSTIPDQQSSPEAAALGLRINEAVRRVASEHHLPLIDYWAALQGLPNNGVHSDHVHPSIYAPNNNPSGGILTDAAIEYGYNMRNLTTLLMLERLMQALDLHA